MTARGAGGAAARKMRIGAFPAEAAFLPALARHWLTIGHDNEGLLILPSRRAAQALAGAFLAENGGRALLLPRIIALGAIDEAGLAMAGALDLPPAIAPMQRQAVLARLILGLKDVPGAPAKLPAAWALAADLAALLDEADDAEVDLAETLPRLVPAELAGHWQTTLKFLSIVTRVWPGILAEMGLMNPAARRMALMDRQGCAWQERPPPHRVWLVAREGNPALRRLARVVAGLPEGMVVLPGYDFGLADAAWEMCGETHPQFGIVRLLSAMGARREEVVNLSELAPSGRSALLSRALLPAEALGDWQASAALDTAGVWRLEAADDAHQAAAIAMVLRDALEVPGRTAALVTPDRALAARVAVALKRFGVTADDSAGERLEQSAPAVFLRLLARAAASAYAPLPLLALLKHPLTAAGLPVGVCRELARGLERHALRGPRPPAGLDGIKYRLAKEGEPAERDFLDRLELKLRALALAEAVRPAEALRAVVEAGEALAATEEEPGAARLWAGDAGIALSELLLEALAALENLPDMARGELPDLLDALLDGAVFRRPRTKDGHPRVAIWGVQEAALQRVDVVVLGGVTEGVWPAAADPGPWLSRPMRKAAGLPAPEEKIGAAAHGFFALACCCGEVVLASAKRRERAPAVPARWLTRLQAMLQGAAMALAVHPAGSWAGQLDVPIVRDTRARPAPRPGVGYRPKVLTISDFATLMVDPYAVYARRILRIAALEALDEESDPAMFGEIVHAGLAEFFQVRDGCEAADAVERLAERMLAAMARLRPRAALEHWWQARLTRIAGWVIAHERARRAARGRPVNLDLELSAALDLHGGFRLKGRVDRIERGVAGGVSVIDYKTGAPPSAAEVESGVAPQLALEAVMAEAGAFGEAYRGVVTELAYLKLSGRAEAGEERVLFARKPEVLRQVILLAGVAVPEIFARFDQAETAYLAAPHPGRKNDYDVYAGISRKAEWAGEE